MLVLLFRPLPRFKGVDFFHGPQVGDVVLEDWRAAAFADVEAGEFLVFPTGFKKEGGTVFLASVDHVVDEQQAWKGTVHASGNLMAVNEFTRIRFENLEGLPHCENVDEALVYERRGIVAFLRDVGMPDLLESIRF